MFLFSKSFSYLGLSLLFIVLVAGCGGGSGGSEQSTPAPAPVVQPVPDPLPTDYVLNIEGLSEEVSFATFSSIESMLQAGQFAQNIVQEIYNTPHSSSSPCLLDSYTATIDGQAITGSIDVGDEVLISFEQCYESGLDDSVEGSVALRIVSFNADKTAFEVALDMSNLAINNDTIRLLGELKVEFEDKKLSSSLIVSASQLVTLQFDGEGFLEFEEFSIAKQNNFVDAIYSVTAQGAAKFTELQAKFSFSQETPFKGYFNETPFEGELLMTNTNSETIRLRAKNTGDPEMAAVVVVRGGILVAWSSIGDGVIWAHNINYSDAANVVPFSESNFHEVRRDQNYNLPSYMVDSTVTLQFSRHVVNPELARIYFRPDFMALDMNDQPYERILASLDVNGAIVDITPVSNLIPNIHYSIEIDDLMSEQSTLIDHAAYFLLFPKPYVKPILKAQTLLFRDNDAPALDASESVVFVGESLAYEWKERSSLGVTIDNPNAVSTTLFIEPGITDTIVMELIVSNENGKSESKIFEIEYVAPNQTVLAFHSQADNFVGGGLSKLLTPALGDFSATLNGGDAHYLSVSSYVNSYFNLDIISRLDAPFVIGSFDNAGSIFDLDENGRSLSFSSQGRTCGRDGLSSFDIFELSQDNEGNLISLALNFTQLCSGSKLFGTVRLNSEYPLNY